MAQNDTYDEVCDLGSETPHVVVLGAGASLASFPNGDKNGRRLPLMNNLVSVCGLDSVLEESGITLDTTNFEELYSSLHASGNLELLGKIESRIAEYFGALELTDGPTTYDLLVISLRPKDLIATFNWDPFLWQAIARNHKWIETPNAVFLHGNVAIGFCPDCWQEGQQGLRCTKCGRLRRPTPLLYPIKQKDYSSNQFISAEWSVLRRCLESAYMITVFGYGAPNSDVEAMELMRNACWSSKELRELRQFEIVDVKNEDELRRTWSPFIVSDHYQVCDRFSDSWIAKHPRRTCETMWQQLEEIEHFGPHPLPKIDDWNGIRKWYQPLIDAERNMDADSK